ncbi:MAG: hypothetical protein LDL33_00090, partial [Desulfomonile sp.]|nr:hypothetical protein [Desulfomonile sp.]
MTSRNTPLVPALWAIVWLVMSAAAAGADTYYESRQKCGIPTVVSTQGVKPNVMIVMDYSGSMQFPAYQPDDSWGGYYSSGVADFSSNITAAYVPGTTYYGLFESDKYYQYYYFDGPTPTPFTGATLAPPNNSGFFAEAPLPAAATPFTITSSASGGSGLITFTTSTSHGYAVGDWVVLSGLDKNKSLNGTGLTVQAVSSNTFTVSGTFGGTADTMGTVQKRIFGSWEAGISGNVLNWLTTSRIDAALKALIGGRSRTGAAEGYVYLDAQGSRRTVVESTNANALAYMRPGTTSDPNSYSSGSYLDKTIYMNVTGRSRGNISNATDPANVTFSGTARPTEWWVYTNTGTSTRTVTISWAGTDSRAFIGVAKAGLTPPSPASPWTSTSSNWLTRDYGNPSVSFDAAPGATYYIAVSANRSSATGYTITHDAPLTAWAPSGYSIADRSPCMVPIASNIMVRLRIPEDERGGVIKEAFDNTRIGMMYYNSVSGNVGKIQGGCGVSDLDTLRSAFESVVPYWGTPTGEAMWEAYDYFKQANDHNNADNSHFISRGTVGVDPYYDRDIFGTAKFMPCRDSYVILVSDGEWNGYVDPIVPARNMHINDLRTAESGDTAKQSVTVFSFYAFSTDDRGKSAMKATAMYGGYTNDCDSPDDWPFPNTSYTRGRANSKGWNWPLPECDPNSAYKPCCKEWNKKYDRNDDGVDDSRGVPDNYYDASDGALLEAGLRTVFQSLMVKTGAAGSVATVAQKVSEHDIVVRAMFRASDPVVKGRYIWRGHLESYYPFDSTYDFEVQDDICKDIAVTSRHCWDAGEVLAGDGASARTIKYGKQVGSAWTLADFTESNLSDLQSKLNAPLCDDSDTPEVACRKLIRWVRGVDGTMGSGMDCYRTRADNLIWLPRTQTEPWPLGDLIYSTPLIVGVPEVAAVSENDPDVAEYQAFRNAEIIKAKTPPAGGSTIHQVYKKMVYVGGNDGMLHAVVLAVANGVDAEGDIVWVDART